MIPFNVRHAFVLVRQTLMKLAPITAISIIYCFAFTLVPGLKGIAFLNFLFIFHYYLRFEEMDIQFNNITKNKDNNFINIAFISFCYEIIDILFNNK